MSTMIFYVVLITVLLIGVALLFSKERLVEKKILDPIAGMRGYDLVLKSGTVPSSFTIPADPSVQKIVVYSSGGVLLESVSLIANPAKLRDFYIVKKQMSNQFEKIEGMEKVELGLPDYDKRLLFFCSTEGAAGFIDRMKEHKGFINKLVSLAGQSSQCEVTQWKKDNYLTFNYDKKGKEVKFTSENVDAMMQALVEIYSEYKKIA